MTAILEYINLVLSDTGQAKTYLQRGFLKPLETPLGMPQVYYDSNPVTRLATV